MRMMDELDQYPLEKRVSVFMRNDRESPKGQRPLPANQTSYVLRDVYQFKNETGYFINLLNNVQRSLTKEHMQILEIRAVDHMIDVVRWWNRLMGFLHFRWFIWYDISCYSRRAVRAIQKNNMQKDYPYCTRHTRLKREEKQKNIAYPYQRSVYILHYEENDLYVPITLRYLYERENSIEISELVKWSRKYIWSEVDPRGPGLRIYPVYEEFSHLEGEELVEAYLDSEPMMELILARCEQEVEIRINERLISVEEVIERIRKGMEPMQWRLEVRL